MSVRSGTAPRGVDPGPPAAPEPRRMRVGPVVLGSLAAGFAAAVILPFVPAGRVDDSFATAMVLFGFAVGWTLLAGVSGRVSHPPHRRGGGPTGVMAGGGGG